MEPRVPEFTGASRTKPRGLHAMLLAFLCLLAALPSLGERCQLARIAEWPVRLEHNRALVDGSINGTQVGVLVDTGASRTLLARSAAERLGLSRVDAGFSFYGIGGRTRAELTEIEEFQLGKAVLKNWRVLVAGDQPMRDVAVVLGEDYFENLDVELDFGNNVMRLYEPKGCENASLAYWAPGTPALKIESARRIAIPVSVGDIRLLAMIDTGASRSTLDSKVAARIGITPASDGVVSGGCIAGIGSRTVDAFIVPVERFTIGDELIRDASIAMADLGGRRAQEEIGHGADKAFEVPEMILGVDFLRAHRVFISHSQRAVYISHNGRSPVFESHPAPTCAERAAAKENTAGPRPQK